ncbi:cupredoxin domain-containing protein [Paenibacillus kobensis]|uniref:cupredoxin domain-containing protein n=1 Tax=Paenibacillus kobensis TaxID=59841 RepID=UPI0013E2908C|nr:plastocyanin/azurin family copper-binding protein [Paenibacillus kobensis]
MLKKKAGLFVLAVLLLFTVGGQFVWAAPDTSTSPQSWDVNVSLAQNNEVSLFSMQPRTLIIHEGDTVKFANNGGLAPHTVTFWGQTTPPTADQIDESYAAPSAPSGSSWDGQTMLNSGIFFPGQSYTVTFTASGVFPYLCLLHSSMKGTIIVVPAGQPIPSKDEQQQEQAAKLKELDQQFADLKKSRSVPSYEKNKNGSITYTGYAGSGTPDLMINLYSPSTFYINEGDTIKWVTDSHDFQFVLINLPKGFAAIDEKGEFNPLLEKPAGGPVFDGKEFVSSGAIMPDMSFQLTFAKAGTYTITDPLWNKTGKVIVAPKGAAKLVVNNVPVLTDVQVKQGQTLIPASSLSQITSAKLVVGKNLTKYTINKKTYVSVVEIVNAIGGKYNWDSVIKTAVVTTK